MIIKVTVKDNDFHNVMMDFCRLVASGEHSPCDPEPKSSSYEGANQWYRQYMEDERFIRRVLKLPSGEASEDEKGTLCNIIRDTFVSYLDKRVQTLSEDTVNYLKREFFCEVVDAVTDEWHNGEVYYIFTSSYVDKVLCM